MDKQNITPNGEEVKGLDGLRPAEAAKLTLKAGRQYVGETGRVTNVIQFQNLGGYFMSHSSKDDPDTEGPDPLFGRWSADGKPVSAQPDSLTMENFGALVSEVAE